jgi:hypothetical protein
MKAIMQDRYGPPSALQLLEIDSPAPAEVLVRGEGCMLPPPTAIEQRLDPGRGLRDGLPSGRRSLA